MSRSQVIGNGLEIPGFDEIYRIFVGHGWQGGSSQLVISLLHRFCSQTDFCLCQASWSAQVVASREAIMRNAQSAYRKILGQVTSSELGRSSLVAMSTRSHLTAILKHLIPPSALVMTAHDTNKRPRKSSADFHMGQCCIELVREGDLVILYFSRENLQYVKIAAGTELQARFGAFRHSDMIGQPYGTKLSSVRNNGFVYLLRPTPELWTQCLKHRTQILYMPDMAFVTSLLNVKPGDSMIEAGTGSGSFTHTAARILGESGALHSFEFHAERYATARAEFAENNLDCVRLRHRDVCKDGFGLNDAVDSIFLDLPAPWEALASAKVAMKHDRIGRICCYSPCMEQVTKTVNALNAHGFSDVMMYETLLQMMEASPAAAPSIDDTITRIKAIEERRSVKREHQIAAAKRKREDRQQSETGHAEDGSPSSKRAKDGHTDSPALSDVESALCTTTASTSLPPAPNVGTANAVLKAMPQLPPKAFTVARAGSRQKVAQVDLKPAPLLRGHTSYLTFATLLPASAEPQDEYVTVKEEPAKQAISA
ncbi:uncharacterized protein L969DRAFT_613213 [Mixia osmundae IAM 14324]|uniref:tRNA (adenine(58)-N(1))-methyltransferase catalytic subunit TRM61 n=1 Tax=Mixia osmundae (strain CBS 9802 / IAM 14324 / JCM 22182 / KY 12970) TaxID=764103 RepID=G7DUN5_MIXOS|nr:uncharacterized protein L969DRAFT_613213 [Mixia osmundae IAM 14324]KEI36373.1 hypothetical protein L969DRAFT_613213 [Mixia osmundae IAM 14324]GAA94295.1 hypothetical protein E5Q_00944 [Mixia osmundae IAM 14324]